MTTQAEPVTHYSVFATERALTGDIHGTLACGAYHWGFVSDDPALVTCEPCKAAMAEPMTAPPAGLPPEAITAGAEALERALLADPPDESATWLEANEFLAGVVLEAAAPHLEAAARERCAQQLAEFHYPGADGLVCQEDEHAWPCRTMRLLRQEGGGT